MLCCLFSFFEHVWQPFCVELRVIVTLLQIFWQKENGRRRRMTKIKMLGESWICTFYYLFQRKKMMGKLSHDRPLIIMSLTRFVVLSHCECSLITSLLCIVIVVKKLTLPTQERYVVLFSLSYREDCRHGRLLMLQLLQSVFRFSPYMGHMLHQ